ncbi:MAG: OmpA family protein [Gammaproteobacteria bacterium]|nr:OmpA family protein [Gammaproteobacteria bacterium]
MKTKFNFFIIITITVAALALASCASAPVENKSLEEARAAYQAAARNPQVTKYAPVALKEAEENLRAVEAQWQSGAKDIDHRAYLAKQKIAIAEQRAKLNAAEDQVNMARAERNKTILEARISDAEKARRIAEIRAQEAEKARAEALSARAEAESLAMELSELKARGTERGLVLTLGDVLFGFNRAELAEGGQSVVSKLSDFLKRYPKRNIMVEGFTDSVGSEDYNIGLSERRASAVRIALIDRGIDPGRIQIRGYGESFPVATNATDAGRQMNRRVEIIISDDQGQISTRTK